jgi:hypothetical protein
MVNLPSVSKRYDRKVSNLCLQSDDIVEKPSPVEICIHTSAKLIM